LQGAVNLVLPGIVHCKINRRAAPRDKLLRDLLFFFRIFRLHLCSGSDLRFKHHLIKIDTDPPEVDSGLTNYAGIDGHPYRGFFD